MPNGTDFVIEDGVLRKYTGPGGDVAIPRGVTAIRHHAFACCDRLTGIAIPEGVTEIGEDAFVCCKALTAASIPGSVGRIGEGAFEGCVSLRRIAIPSGVAEISDAAFHDCAALASVTIAEGVTDIGEGAFRGCVALKEMVIPSSVMRLGDAALEGCRSLEAFVVSPASGRYSAVDGVVFSKNGHRLVAYPPGRSRDRYDIPETVTEVADNAFAGAPVGLVFVHSGVACFPETAEGDPYVASGNAAFISRLGRPVYLGPPEELSNKNRRRAVEGFLFALEAGTPEIEPWREDYIDCIRREYVTWEKRAWRSGTLLRLMIDRRMLRPETAENMRRKYVSSGREDMALLLSDYIASAGG